MRPRLPAWATAEKRAMAAKTDGNERIVTEELKQERKMEKRARPKSKSEEEKMWKGAALKER